MKVLLIEDEPKMARSLKKGLEEHQIEVDAALDGLSGYQLAVGNEYAVIISDIILPELNGIDLLLQLRNTGNRTPVILLSALGQTDDKVTGFEAGADDYLTKPFHLAELNARLKSIVRRRQFDGNTDIVFNEIRLIPENHEVFVNDNRVTLTGKEFDLLLFFISNKGRVLPKDSIAEHIWGDHMDQSNSFDFIYTHIKNMRRKLVDAGCKDYLTTVYGIGYKFHAE